MPRRPRIRARSVVSGTWSACREVGWGSVTTARQVDSAPLTPPGLGVRHSLAAAPRGRGRWGWVVFSDGRGLRGPSCGDENRQPLLGVQEHHIKGQCIANHGLCASGAGRWTGSGGGGIEVQVDLRRSSPFETLVRAVDGVVGKRQLDSRFQMFFVQWRPESDAQQFLDGAPESLDHPVVHVRTRPPQDKWAEFSIQFVRGVSAPLDRCSAWRPSRGQRSP